MQPEPILPLSSRSWAHDRSQRIGSCPSRVRWSERVLREAQNLWDHLEQLVREGKLKQLLHHSSGRVSQASSEMCGDAFSRLPLGTINVIFAALGRTRSCPSRVLSVCRPSAEDNC